MYIHVYIYIYIYTYVYIYIYIERERYTYIPSASWKPPGHYFVWFPSSTSSNAFLWFPSLACLLYGFHPRRKRCCMVSVVGFLYGFRRGRKHVLSGFRACSNKRRLRRTEDWILRDLFPIHEYVGIYFQFTNRHAGRQAARQQAAGSVTCPCPPCS